MIVKKAYKFRLYPNKTQCVLLAKTFGCVRVVWNRCVATFNSYDKETNPKPEYQSSTKIRNEFEWRREVSAAALEQKAMHFKEYQGQKFNKNRKKQLGQPKFKSKNDRQSFRLPNQKFYVKGNRIQLEKIGKVKIVLDREIPADAKCVNVTVSRNKAGQYFASILVEETIRAKPKTNKTIGIDVGLNSFLKTSDDKDKPNPRYFRKSQTKLAHLQRLQSRKKGSKKGEAKSRRWKKLHGRINRLHQKIANQRDWFLHDVSSKLVNDYDAIYSETLNVAGMLRNHCLAKSIADASWSTLFSYIAYKSEWYGKQYHQIDTFRPSTKTCSLCGKKDDTITLKDRVIICPFCSFTEDRDLRAAKNIKAFGVEDALRTQSDAHE
jgi:putative transposase